MMKRLHDSCWPPCGALRLGGAALAQDAGRARRRPTRRPTAGCARPPRPRAPAAPHRPRQPGADAQQGRHRVDADVAPRWCCMMSVPALALFYGGMVRSKNMLSVLMQVFVVFSLITVLWCVYGYSLAFTEGNALHSAASTGCSSRARSTPPRASSPWPRPSARASRSPSSVRRVPGDLRGHHLLPDRRRLRRAHEVLARCCCSWCCGSPSPTCRSRTWCGTGGSGCLHRRQAWSTR